MTFEGTVEQIELSAGGGVIDVIVVRDKALKLDTGFKVGDSVLVMDKAGAERIMGQVLESMHEVKG